MPTMDDIAARAGVSKTTVSRVFSRPQSVAEGTRQRVLAAARDLSYEPPRSSHAAGGSGNIGLFVPDIANPYFAPLIKTVQAEARRQGFGLFITSSDEHTQEEFALVRGMAAQVDGVLLASPRMADADIAKMRELAPLVLINRDVPGIPGVMLSSEAGMTQAVEHLVTLGHTELVYLSGPEASFTAAERRSCLMRAAERFGVDVIQLGPFEPRYSSGLRAADLALATGRTAVIAYNDLMALGLMAQITERGVQVGGGISVIGFDDSWLASVARPALTTVRVPVSAAGVTAVRRLAEAITAAGSAPPTIRLESELIIRATTGFAVRPDGTRDGHFAAGTPAPADPIEGAERQAR